MITKRRKITIEKKDKKGNMLVLVGFFLLLFLVLFFGIIIGFGSVVLNYAFDVITPAFLDIGEVGTGNVSDYARMSVGTVNTIVQNFTWMAGVIYVMALIGIIAIAVVFRTNPSLWLTGLFLGFVLLLIMGSIIISNIYEDFYVGTDEVSSRLQEHELLSFMVLHSPVIITVISFISGMILFTGVGREFA